MDDEKKAKSLVDEFVSACGLPSVRGTASVRRALWHMLKIENEPSREDLQEILPQLQVTLTSYMPPSDVDECMTRGKRFLCFEEESSAEHSLRDVREALRKANEHLRKSTELDPALDLDLRKLDK